MEKKFAVKKLLISLFSYLIKFLKSSLSNTLIPLALWVEKHTFLGQNLVYRDSNSKNCLQPGLGDHEIEKHCVM